MFGELVLCTAVIHTNAGGNIIASGAGSTVQLPSGTVYNAGGTITANGAGATVQLFNNSTIQGGTLTNNGGWLGAPQHNLVYLDGSTNGPLTINGTYTGDYDSRAHLLGTINNTGTIQVNGGNGYDTYLQAYGDVTLQGGGTVTMSVAGGGGSAYLDRYVGSVTLSNVDNTIQGAGSIGNGTVLNMVNQSVVNANSLGQGLYLNPAGLITNTGLMEASNGGYLVISGAYGLTVNNAGGNITANSGSTVQFTISAYIQGGTLTNNGGWMGTVANRLAYLDGTTNGALTINSTYTGDYGSQTYLLGTINNTGTIQVNGGNGYNSALEIANNLTLQGGGTVNLATAGGGGQAIIEQPAGGTTLTNVDNTIQGAGSIGNGTALNMVNQSVVNANSLGPGLYLNPSGVITNTGLMEASNGGDLYLSGVYGLTVNNAGGNITANNGSTVQVYGGASIQGGTLTNNGGWMGTVAGVAYLDGATNGALTINGTYTGDFHTQTELLGTINNHGTIQVNGGNGYNSYLEIANNLTLQGVGTVNLSTAGGGGQAIIEQPAGGITLTNVDNTIQGAGIIGNNGLSVVNGAAGTILANVPGQTLYVVGPVTNNGLLQAANNGVLQFINGVTLNNPGGNITASSGSAVQFIGITVDNTGGNITANGAGSTVQLPTGTVYNAGGTITANGAGSAVQLAGNSTIQGGTLTNNGGSMGAPPHTFAYLDGSTNGALTINSVRAMSQPNPNGLFSRKWQFSGHTV